MSTRLRTLNTTAFLLALASLTLLPHLYRHFGVARTYRYSPLYYYPLLRTHVVAGHEVLFLSEQAVFNGAKAIRGGIPLVFPQVK